MASPVEGSALTNLNSDKQYLFQLVEEFGQTLWFPLTVINCQFSDYLKLNFPYLTNIF